MVTITQEGIGNCNTQNWFVHPNGLTVSTEIVRFIHLWSDDSLKDAENFESLEK